MDLKSIVNSIVNNITNKKYLKKENNLKIKPRTTGFFVKKCLLKKELFLSTFLLFNSILYSINNLSDKYNQNNMIEKSAHKIKQKKNRTKKICGFDNKYHHVNLPNGSADIKVIPETSNNLISLKIKTNDYKSIIVDGNTYAIINGEVLIKNISHNTAYKLYFQPKPRKTPHTKQDTINTSKKNTNQQKSKLEQKITNQDTTENQTQNQTQQNTIKHNKIETTTQYTKPNTIIQKQVKLEQKLKQKVINHTQKTKKNKTTNIKQNNCKTLEQKLKKQHIHYVYKKDLNKSAQDIIAKILMFDRTARNFYNKYKGNVFQDMLFYVNKSNRIKIDRSIFKYYAINEPKKLEYLLYYYINHFNNDFKQYANIANNINQKELAQMYKIFEEYKLPKEFVLISVIESNYNVNAKSFAGAYGLFQQTDSNAKAFFGKERYSDKKSSKYYDERRNFYFASEAAAKFLKTLKIKIEKKSKITNIDLIKLMLAGYNGGFLHSYLKNNSNITYQGFLKYVSYKMKRTKLDVANSVLENITYSLRLFALISQIYKNKEIYPNITKTKPKNYFYISVRTNNREVYEEVSKYAKWNKHIPQEYTEKPHTIRIIKPVEENLITFNQN